MIEYVTTEIAIREINSGDKVFIHSAAATPNVLVQEMVKRAHELKGVDIYQIHTEGDCSYAREEFKDSFNIHAFFNGSNIRHARNNHIYR